MPADFSHLAKLNVSTDKVVEFPLWMVRGRPVFMVTSASEVNADYLNEMLRRTGKHLRQLRLGALDKDLIDENRRHVRALFPLHIIRGWKGVVDASGKEVAFSPDECVAYMKHLPDWIVDELSTFCQTITNFTDEIEPQAVAKN